MAYVDLDIKRIGNSLGIIIPKRLVNILGLREKETVSVKIEKRQYLSGFGIFKGAKPYREDKEEHEDLW